jgi:hypothetical protein
VTSLRTEWKVKLASLGAFAGSLIASVALDVYAPSIVNNVPGGLRTLTAAAIAAAVSWLSGWVARTRPECVSPSTVDAVLRARGDR